MVIRPTPEIKGGRRRDTRNSLVRSRRIGVTLEVLMSWRDLWLADGLQYPMRVAAHLGRTGRTGVSNAVRLVSAGQRLNRTVGQWGHRGCWSTGFGFIGDQAAGKSADD